MTKENFSVCTLFEGDYGQGVAVLVNSLVHSGYCGVVYCGFRGPIPAWCRQYDTGATGSWSFDVSDRVRIEFLAIETEAHLTNYKPEFMLQLLDGTATSVDGLYYVDPDIVVDEQWEWFEEWLSCGITVCEDINSPLAEGHPRRVGWRRFFASHGIKLNYRSDGYANGGFVGVRRANIDFLLLWARLQQHMWAAIGGADRVGIAGGKLLSGMTGFGDCFGKTDQDALNAALEAWSGPVSILNGQAMGFKPGKAILPHALGPKKPWRRRYILEALGGNPPTAADKAYWNMADRPIQIYSAMHLFRRRLSLRIAAALGRIIRRN